MSTEENTATIRRFFDELNKLNVAGLDDVCTPDFKLHFPGAPGALPREGAKQFFGMFFAAFPDIQHTLEDQLAEGDKVAVRLTIRGTQQGEFQGIPATGKAITMTSLNILHFANGKIAEQWVETDSLGLLQQLGAIPTPGQPAPTPG
jgi:predicted ester cyclase